MKKTELRGYYERARYFGLVRYLLAMVGANIEQSRPSVEKASLSVNSFVLERSIAFWLV